MTSASSSSEDASGHAGEQGLDPDAPTQALSYHSNLGQEVVPASVEVPADEMNWNARYKLLRKLGSGAQGVVYLALREGVDGYSTRVALKLYSRDQSVSESAHVTEMQRIAHQGQKISEIQHDNLVNIRDFVALGDTRVMVMEWVDGLDLRELLSLKLYRESRERISSEDWDRLNDMLVTPGEDHCILRPAAAVDILRGCLAGLSSLHQHEIIHSDLKPANIMIKRTGTKKLIDMDSSCDRQVNLQAEVRGTPYYMAPELIRDREVRYRSDIASLGYVLIEMLTGQLLFKDCKTLDQLLEKKLHLPQELPRMARKVPRYENLDLRLDLIQLCSKMIAIDPKERFPDAEAADISNLGAASFHRQLVKHNLSAEYSRDLGWWIDLVHPFKDE
ncbi:MAG: serine/threonine-protein kinase [Planctomycetota bacterium]|nr:serine/threonine-protein kinase [Planctomycetota bacterium]